jgi:hypothetical protein
MAQAPAQAPLLGEQPNISEISIQVGRFNNLPAVTDTDRILEAIAQLDARMETRFTEMETRLTGSDTNASTRLVNNRNVIKPTHDIEPLVTCHDGADIPDFPRTVNDVMAIQSI